MTVERGQGNLLKAEVDALVNTVNTVGVMGKGIALQFKRAFPANFKAYEKACKAGEVTTGKVFVHRQLTNPRLIVNFPTKRHWRQPSKIEYIREGLADLVSIVRENKVESIAIPPLGCGAGGLNWAEVKPLIEEAFASLANVRVLLFEPGLTPSPSKSPDRRPALKMTPGRAALLSAMRRYLEPGYDRLSLVEVQKLAYFLQLAGEPLRLNFSKHRYGPYADTLRKALRNMEGKFITGLGDGKNAPDTVIQLDEDAVKRAETFLKEHPETSSRIARVAELIEGFETPLGMELLGTVHWVMANDGAAVDPDAAFDAVSAWNTRKREQMKKPQIGAAWKRLRDHSWTQSSVTG